MAGYVSLLKFTDKGRTDAKSMPDQIGKAKQQLQKMGVRLIGLWMTLGEYDAVAIYDAPDDLTMAAVLLTNEMQGMTTSHTMRALSEDEVAQVTKRLS